MVTIQVRMDNPTYERLQAASAELKWPLERLAAQALLDASFRFERQGVLAEMQGRRRR